MKEVFLVGCHITNELQLSYLSELIHKLKSARKDYIIVSHTTIPDFLTKDSKAYLYDSENTIINYYDYGSKFLFYFANEQFRLRSTTLGSFGLKSDPAKCYSLAVEKLFVRGLSLCKLYKYDVIHWIEYDTNLNIAESDDNFSIMSLDSSIPAIFYKYDLLNYRDENIGLNPNLINGNFFTIKSDSINNDLLKLGDDGLIDLLSKYNFICERCQENELVIGSPKIKHISSTPSKDESLSYDTPFAFYEHDGFINVFLWNKKNFIDKFIVSSPINKIEIDMIPNSWHMTSFCKIGEIESISIKSGSVNLSLDLSQPKIYDYYIKSSIFESL